MSDTPRTDKIAEDASLPTMGKTTIPYRPSNGTEGSIFIEGWCCRCAHDKEMNGTCAKEGRVPSEDDWCEILSRSFRTDEPLPEWQIGDDGEPCCVAYTASDQPVRCERTADMFGQ